jgi:hypothetical protein
MSLFSGIIASGQLQSFMLGSGVMTVGSLSSAGIKVPQELLRSPCSGLLVEVCYPPRPDQPPNVNQLLGAEAFKQPPPKDL